MRIQNPEFKMQKSLIILLMAILLMAAWGCDSSTSSHQGANVVMIGDFMETYAYPNVFYIARLKNEGELPAFGLQMWVTCYDSSGQFLALPYWQSSIYDTLYPGLSRLASVTLESLLEAQVDCTVVDIEWRD